MCGCSGLGKGGAISLVQPSLLPILLTDNSNQVVTIILVAAAVTLISVCTAAYLYNRQRKIREYKLQKAREANAMKLNTPP